MNRTLISLSEIHISEREVLQQVASADEKAFYVLHRHYYAQLKPLVLKYTGSDADAQEVLQVTFLKVWLNREVLGELEHFGSWVSKIAYREYITLLRKKLRYEAHLTGFAEVQTASEGFQLPEDSVSVADITRCVQEAVNSLAPQRRRIFELNRQEGLSISEIAERLSLSPQTVKNVLQVSQKLIRDHLIASGYGPLPLIIFFPIFF